MPIHAHLDWLDEGFRLVWTRQATSQPASFSTVVLIFGTGVPVALAWAATSNLGDESAEAAETGRASLDALRAAGRREQARLAPRVGG